MDQFEHRDHSSQVRELERKYLLKYQPLFDQRAAIVSGEVEPTGEEGEADSEEEDEDDDGDDEGAGVWFIQFMRDPWCWNRYRARKRDYSEISYPHVYVRAMRIECMCN